MKRHWRSWPQRFIRWLFGSPFRKLPAPFGPTVPADLQAFEDEAQEAQRHGVRSTIATPATRHAKTRPARSDSSLERQ